MDDFENLDNLDFNSEFGTFHPESVERESLAKIRQTNESEAQPCRECGRYPRVHVANFSDRASYPNNVYVDCKCGQCDGKWYENEEKALEAWDARNLGATPKRPDDEDDIDFVDKIMENFKIPD